MIDGKIETKMPTQPAKQKMKFLSTISLVLWLCIFIFYNYIATYEEKRLEQIFGQDYIDYKKKVPKWLPRLRSIKIDS